MRYIMCTSGAALDPWQPPSAFVAAAVTPVLPLERAGTSNMHTQADQVCMLVCKEASQHCMHLVRYSFDRW